MVSEYVNKFMQQKLFFKIAFILFLILLLMIPNLLIQNLILERQGLEYQTQNEIASSWGPNQTMIGPVLSIPFTKEITTDDGISTFEYTLRVLPKTINLEVSLDTQERQKSIYKVILYNAAHELDGLFEIPDLSKFGKNVKSIHWDNATVDFGFTSSASLDEIVYLEWNSESYKMQSGASDNNLFSSAIHAAIPLSEEQKEYSFKTTIGLNGSKAINYLPLAENTSVSMNSNWTAPGFIGLPLPSNRDMTDVGFSAQWKLTEYNRAFKNTWIDNEVQLMHRAGTFGVDLVQTVGHYQKNMRSAKYALLIISLSFMVFFFFEMLKGNRIHFVQYIFVGLALSIFYTLLLSFSEHIGFDLAYLVSAGAVVGLISWYSRFILHKGSNVFILTLILGGLYLYIYILLQMEEFALLVGSVGLFIVLAVTMYLSRHFNWYDLSGRKDEVEG